MKEFTPKSFREAIKDQALGTSLVSSSTSDSPFQSSETDHPHDIYEWECPDCEAITNGTKPVPVRCRCGQTHIIRNLTAEENETDLEAMAEASV